MTEKKKASSTTELYDSMLDFALKHNKDETLSKDEVEQGMREEMKRQLKDEMAKTARRVNLMKKLFPSDSEEIDVMVRDSGLNGKFRGQGIYK